jgi:hypothetical protein
MTITPRSLASAEGERFEHGSVLGGKTRADWVSSQWKSTPPPLVTVDIDDTYDVARSRAAQKSKANLTF